MVHNRFDYVDQENSKIVLDLVEKADQIDIGTGNVINSVRFFLKNDQYRIKTGDPSVSAADKLMKSLAAIFNDKRSMLKESLGVVLSVEKEINATIDKLSQAGHASKILKLKEALACVTVHIEPINTLIDELNSAKKGHLTNLKTRILKAERVRHFKNLK